MGLSGGKSGGLLRHFDPNGLAAAQALLEGDYGAAAQIIAQQRRLAAERQQAEAEAKARRGAESSRAAMLEAFGYGADEIAALRPEEASRLVMERLRDRRTGVGPAGRSLFQPPRAPSPAMSGLFSGVKAAQIIPEGGRPSFWHGPPGRGAGRTLEDRLLKAIVLSEGSVGPNGEWMTSPRGATGPAQVRPATAREVAQQENIPWDEHRYRSDPDYNLALGRAYYFRLLREFRDPVFAAAAYNWGPTAFRSAMRESKRTGRPLKTYLPDETLKYVTRFASYLRAD